MRPGQTARLASSVNAACIVDKVRLLNRAVTRLYDEALQPLGLTTNQMNVLGATAMHQPATPADVAAWLSMDKSTVSRHVAALRRRGWLETLPEPGRRHRLRLTRAGTRLFEQAVTPWSHAQQRARSLLGRHGVGELVRAADTIRSGATPP